KTLILEKAAFPRDKVCGCTLNQTAETVLTEIGVSLSSFAVPLSKVEVRFDASRHLLPLSSGWVCSRKELDSRLVGAAIEAGVKFLDRVRLEPREEKEHSLELSISRCDTREKLETKLLIIATGLRSAQQFGFH